MKESVKKNKRKTTKDKTTEDKTIKDTVEEALTAVNERQEMIEQCRSPQVEDFDLDRLANEIQKVVDEKISFAVKRSEEISEDMKRTSRSWRDEFDDGLEKADKKVESVKVKLDSTLNGMDEKLEQIKSDFSSMVQYAVKEVLDSISPEFLERIVADFNSLRLPDGVVIPTEAEDHPELKNIVKSLSVYGKALLVGPAGTGKSYMCKQISDRMELKFFKYSCSRDSNVQDLTGYLKPNDGQYLTTSFLEAYENGGIFLLDEFDALSSDMSLFFNGIADGSSFISLPHREGNTTANRHDKFFLILAGNTWGSGSLEYTGRDFQDQALLDRFRMCKHYIGYNVLLEEHFCKSYDVDYAQINILRDAMESAGSYLSTRNIEDFCKFISVGYTFSEGVKALIQDLPEIQKEKVLTFASWYE